MNHWIFKYKFIAFEIDTFHWSLGIKLFELNPYNYGWCLGISLFCFHLHFGYFNFKDE